MTLKKLKQGMDALDCLPAIITISDSQPAICFFLLRYFFAFDFSNS
jgi:hypothetical protein